MMIKDMIEVLGIVSKYVDPTSEWLESDHDVIYLPLMDDTPIETLDKIKLEELGAHIGDSGCWEVYT